MEFQMSHFKSSKMMLLKCCTQYANKYGKRSSGHRTGKGQFSFKSQRKGNVKECLNYCTTVLISHACKIMFKILQARLQQYVNWKLSDVQAGFRKRRDQRSNCQHPLDHIQSKGIPKTSASLTMLKPLTVLVQFSHSEMSNYLWPHGLQHSRLPCPSLTPGACSNSCPLSQWCHPTISSSVIPFSSCPQSFPASGSFSNESALRIRWPKYWSFSVSISLSNENPGLISFRMDWLDLLAVQRTLKSLLQHHSSKASSLRHSAFFIVQLSHPYMTTGKTKALTRWTFIGKIMSLFFNMLSRLVIALLPRSKCLLISLLQPLSAVILEPPKIKSSTVSASICHEVMGPYAVIFVFWMLSFKPS